jgi:hypothetical protein
MSAKPAIFLLLLMGGCLFFVACEKENTPTSNFDIFWQDFDERYAQFEHRGIDWEAVKNTYRPRVTDDTTDKVLFNILAETAGILNDSHVTLYGNGRYYRSGRVGAVEADDFDLDLVKNDYLKETKQDGEKIFTYGWVEDGVGYLHIYQMYGDNSDWYEHIDKVLSYFEDAKAMIVDIRGNQGGMSAFALEIAGRFADKKRLVQQSRYRTGPNHNDLGPVTKYYVTPKGERFKGPVVLLSNLFTMSAAESFALAMLSFPNVTHMGAATGGAFATTVPRELLNGWTYFLPVSLETNAKGECLEGLGIIPTPENQMSNTPEDLEQDVDAVLEFALEKLSK